MDIRKREDPVLERLLEKAAEVEVTPEMLEAQRQSWLRGELGLLGYDDEQIAELMEEDPNIRLVRNAKDAAYARAIEDAVKVMEGLAEQGRALPSHPERLKNERYHAGYVRALFLQGADEIRALSPTTDEADK